MWSAEHSIETTATPQRIWQSWADVSSWPEWNGDIEQIELAGSFATGGRIVMKPFGQDPVELRITDARQPELFVDEADLGEVIVRTTHRVQALGEGQSRITYRMEISGAQADALGPEIGPQISGDFPQTLAALAARAERR